jgi:hypothetical protein
VKTPEFPNQNYTYEDYLKWDGQWELIDGVPYSMAPSHSFTHQYIVGESCMRRCGIIFNNKDA